MHEIPKYSEFQIEIILDSNITLPENINENFYQKQLKENQKLKWKMNPFLSKKGNLVLLLEPAIFKKWLLLKRLNWLIAIFIVGFSLYTNNYDFCWALIIFPIFISSGLLDHWMIVSGLVILFILKSIIGFNGNFFWFILTICLVTSLLSKATHEFLEKSIFKVAFTDPNTFLEILLK